MNFVWLSGVFLTMLVWILGSTARDGKTTSKRMGTTAKRRVIKPEGLRRRHSYWIEIETRETQRGVDTRGEICNVNFPSSWNSECELVL